MRISFIGSGNVATHLAAAFRNAGHRIVQIWSRERKNADILAYHVQAQATDKLSEFDSRTDLVVISVSDDAIKDVLTRLTLIDQILVHTSGSTPLDVLKTAASSYGVFYPLQTFSKIKSVDFLTVPLAVEGNTGDTVSVLKQLASDISNRVIELDSQKRLSLHLAAVFASNFSNYLYAVAKDILVKNHLDFSLLLPLIQETADKIKDHSPEDVQTGPALRNDQGIIQKHLQFLAHNPEQAELYTLLSQQIINFYHKS